MHIWVDLANSPHVPFFRPLITEFRSRGHEVSVTARDFAQTVRLAEAAGLDPVVISGHGGRDLSGKAGNLIQRSFALLKWARRRGFDLAVSHNSYSQVLASRALRIRSVTLMDYEHQPANHLAFRLASKVIVPEAFPEDSLRKFGARPARVRRYAGIKEDVYLADFEPDPAFAATLARLGIEGSDVLVVVRPPASEALYHRFENQLFDKLIERLKSTGRVRLLMLPRTPKQREELMSRHQSSNIVIPSEVLDGSNLIASADLIVSAGGTMNREAAALGVPAATIYAGRWAALDEQLVRDGRLRRISDEKDIELLPVEKRTVTEARRAGHVRSQVADLILER